MKRGRISTTENKWKKVRTLLFDDNWNIRNDKNIILRNISFLADLIKANNVQSQEAVTS